MKQQEYINYRYIRTQRHKKNFTRDDMIFSDWFNNFVITTIDIDTTFKCISKAKFCLQMSADSKI